MPPIKNTAVIFISSGVLVDGGGFWIDANGHIHRIPPWNPETLAQLTVGATMLNNVRHITDTNLGRQVESIAQEVIAGAMPQVEKQLGAITR